MAWFKWKSSLLLVVCVLFQTTLISAESEIWVSYKNDIFEATINAALFKDIGYYTHMIQQQRLSYLKQKLGLLERPFWKAKTTPEEQVLPKEELILMPKVSFVTIQLNSRERYVFNSSYCTCSVTSSTTCLRPSRFSGYCATYTPCVKYHCTTTGSELCQRVQRSALVAGSSTIKDPNNGVTYTSCSNTLRELAFPVS